MQPAVTESATRTADSAAANTTNSAAANTADSTEVNTAADARLSSQQTDGVLAELCKQAVLGLNRLPGGQTGTETTPLEQLPAGRKICQALAEQNSDGKPAAASFLDSLALAFHSSSCSRLPATEAFDELPPQPDEDSLLSPARLLQLQKIADCGSQERFWLLARLADNLQQKLPTCLVIQAMEQDHNHSNRQDILNSASAPALWLSQLTPELIRDCDLHPPQPFPAGNRFALWLQEADSDVLEAACKSWRDLSGYWQKHLLALLHRVKAPERWRFIRQLWPHAGVSTRITLVSKITGLLFADPDQGALQQNLNREICSWLEQQDTDRSAKVVERLVILRAVAANSLPAQQQSAADTDVNQALQQELARYIPLSLLKKPDPQPPETLTEPLKALGIRDSGGDDSRAVGRLQQLVLMAGPERLARHLKTDTATAVKRLLNSRFGAELSVPLMMSSLLYRNPDALISWAHACPEPDADTSWALLEALNLYDWTGSETLLLALADLNLQQFIINSGLVRYLMEQKLQLSPQLSSMLAPTIIQPLLTDPEDKSHAPQSFDFLLRWAGVLDLPQSFIRHEQGWAQARSHYPAQPELTAFEAALAFMTPE